MLGIALALPLLLFMVVDSVRTFVGSHPTEPEFSVFLELGAEEAAIRATRARLGTLQGIDSIRFVPRQEALSLLRKSPALADVLDALPDNPLPDAFTLRASEGFVENFGPSLLARVAEVAPGIRLGFVPKLDRDSSALRDGTVDLETGVLGSGMGPEIRVQALFRDRFIGVATYRLRSLRIRRSTVAKPTPHRPPPKRPMPIRPGTRKSM